MFGRKLDWEDCDWEFGYFLVQKGEILGVLLCSFSFEFENVKFLDFYLVLKI